MCDGGALMSGMRLHYTDRAGYNGIRATPKWLFRASQPPGVHPVGAYFTDYKEDEPLLAQKLRIPRGKLEFVFCFSDADDLKALPGGRGRHIFYSAVDYIVSEPRQLRHGETGL